MEFDANGNPIVKSGSATGTATPPAPTPAPETDPEALVLSNFETDDPAILKKGFKALQAESKEHRLKAAKYKQERDANLAELERLRNEKTAADQAKLEEEKKFKELWEQEKAQKAEVTLAAQKVAIDARIENHFLAKGIDAKFIKLLDRNGINIDSTGAVKGVAEAFERMELEYGDILTLTPKKKAAAAAGDDDDDAPTDPPSITSIRKKPGTNMTYDEYAKLVGGKEKFNAGKPPAGGGAAPPSNKPDFSKMTKAEQDQWYKTYKAGLSKKK